MELNSEIEFPPIEACLKSPHHIKSTVGTPSAAMNSSLNPSAEAFTPRSTINFNNCLGTSTPEQLPQINVEMVEGDVNIGAGGDGIQLKNISLNQSKSRLNSNTKTKSSGRKPFSGGKRRLSMTSIANSTISSIDTNISDKLENENDTDVLSRREKNITYGKSTGAYERYIQVMPKKERNKNSPRTPIKELKYSRRQWDGLIKHWKIKLHDWDRDSNGVPSHPSASTPKRLKTKCDRRSLGNSTPLSAPLGHTIGDMLPPSIKMMFSNVVDTDKEQTEIQDKETQNPNLIDWSQNLGTERIMDWSKECETSEDETEQDESQNKENMITRDEDNQVSLRNLEAKSVQNDNEVKQTSSKEEANENVPDDKLQTGNDDEEGMVYECVSLVDAIAQFDEKTYNEDEDEDYVPPEERGLTLEEIGNDASDEDSDDSSGADNLFYQLVQRNKPFKL